MDEIVASLQAHEAQFNNRWYHSIKYCVGRILQSCNIPGSQPKSSPKLIVQQLMSITNY
jgi:hypothetical protein